MTTLAIQAAQFAGNALVQTASSVALSYAGTAISNAFDSRTFEGPRLESFHLQTSREGAPMARIYGRIRLAGQVIWASRVKEVVTEERVQSGKGGGPTQRNYSYTISFAIGLCEGEILGIDRLWANGVALQIPGLVTRVYKGTADQQPDPIISAIEGGAVSAFRNTAYIVFEDFPLDDYGARLPQINAEVIRMPPVRDDGPRLETMVRGVNLLPASGEFAYATEIVEETPTPTSSRPINMNNLSGKVDIELALDQLETQLPNVRNVSIITAWFGTDLRCGDCEIKPGVETKVRITPDVSWRVSGVTRGTAYLVSQDADGRPAYGGTPSDSSILQAIASLKSRGYQVTLYPFILMDIPVGNGSPDPYGGAEQGAFPWRGRITSYPRSIENTAAVNAQIDSFFGMARPADFGVENSMPNYTGPDEFSYQRFILHYAKLAQISGGVDRFVIGSEMRSLTTLRGVNNSYPAVQKLVTLAENVRSILNSQTAITYSADWSEYFGHHPQDQSGDLSFHLDPLWTNSAIDAIGIDAYFPLSDWRDTDNHLDSEIAENIYDMNYLKSQVEGGEGYDYFYASQADRDAQNRTLITDGTANKPWVYRYKDLRNWWSNLHYNRRDRSELSMPTNWIPQSKPIWLMEVGCPAIDKGSNEPNVFYDSKSSESNIPYYSNTSRDDLVQRKYLEAFINYWSETSGNNPISTVYDGPMIATDMINVWAWDARPFPDFPARDSVWSDGENWQRGHWLSGRMGLIPLADVVQDLALQSGLQTVDVSAVNGLVQGYHIDRPMTARAALSPLAALYGFNLIETPQGLRFASFGTEVNLTLGEEDIVDNLSSAIEQIKDTPEDKLKDARVHFIDATNDYQLGLASARDLTAETMRVADVNAPLVMDQSFARFMAKQLLRRSLESDTSINFQLSGKRLDIEVGDLISLPNNGSNMGDVCQIEILDGLITQRVQARRVEESLTLPNTGAEPGVTGAPTWAAKPILFAFDIPGDYDGPLVGVGLDPFSITQVNGPTSDVTLSGPARIGALLSDLPYGPIGRWDNAAIFDAFLPSLALSSLSDDAILAGSNRFAVETKTGWEIIQAGNAALISPSTYRLSHLLRGQHGSDVDMEDVISSGARLIWLGSGLQDLAVPDDYTGDKLSLSAFAAGRESDPLDFIYKAAHLRPLAPVHLKQGTESGQTTISWTRRTRRGGDSWAGLDVPLGEDAEIYRVQFLTGGNVTAEYEVPTPQITRPKSEIIAADEVSVTQGSQAYGWGAEVRKSIQPG